MSIAGKTKKSGIRAVGEYRRKRDASDALVGSELAGLGAILNTFDALKRLKLRIVMNLKCKNKIDISDCSD